MTALSGLLKKEFRLVQTATAVAAGVLFLYFVSLFVASTYYKPEYVRFFVMIPEALSIWFVPIKLMQSFEAERKKLHLWLHSPQSAWTLLGAKFVVAIGTSIALNVLVIMGISTYHALFLFDSELHLLRDWRHVVSLGFGTLLAGSYFAIWLTFGWVVFHVFNRFLKKMSLPVTIGLLAAAIALIVHIETGGWFAQLAHWTGTTFHFPIVIEGNVESSSGALEALEIKVSPGDVNALHLFFHIGIACLLFILSCRLIDREVEV